MPIHRPRPGRYLYRHIGGDVETNNEHATGSFDPDDPDRLPPDTLEDLGGAFVEGPDGERFEVDHVFATSPRVVEATSPPPFGEWEQIDSIDIPDPDEAWEQARNFGQVEEFRRIPTVDEDPVFQLNEIANPIGHTVEWEGEFLRIRPTGAVQNHQCQYLATSLGDARQYLRSRAQRTVWTLDIQDPRYEVRWAEFDSKTAIELVDVETGERSAAIDGGVTSANTRDSRGEPIGFFSRADEPPATGRWYR